jgi:saccharopine dehydrogenase-like NADP-dependent oxidoreductase
MAKKIGCDFKEIETIEAGFCWDSNVPEFVPPFCISDAAYELFYDAWVIISKAYKSIEPLSYSKEYDFPLIGRKKVYAISHIELFSFLDYFQDKNIQNVFFYGGFPEHCIEVLKCLDKLNLIKQRNNVIKIPDQQGKTHSFTNQDIITAISKRIETPKNYTETEIVWSTIIGKDFNNKEMVKTMLCKVPPIEGWEQHGCNVDTGVPAGVIAEIILKDKVLPGVYMPEGAIDPDPFIKELEDFGFEFIIQDSFL